MSKSVKATSAALRAAKNAAQSPAPAQPVLVQSPAPAPVSPAPVKPAVRTIADISQDIDKVSAALDTSRKAGFTDIVVQAEKRLAELHREKAALSPAAPPARVSAAVVEDVVAVSPAPVSAVSAAPAVGLVVAEVKDGNGRLLGVITVPQKDFKTGSRGYYANAKIEIGGKRYQTQIQLVEIGSKPAGDSK